MQKFRSVIVGCGHISPMHALSIQQTENVELVACCDLVEERAAQRAKDFGIGKYYLDMDEMLAAEKPDVVHLCTPHNLHAPMAIRAMEAGCHVMTEKPMSIHLKDAQAMIETSKRTGKTLGVIFQNRYNAGSVLVRRLLDDGTIGKIKGVRAFLTWIRSEEYYVGSNWKGTWEGEGGGVVIDQAIHTLDMIRYLVGQPIDYIQANIDNREHDYIEVEDVADGIIAFKGGVKAAFYAMNYYAWNAPVEMEVYCENGSATMVLDEAVVKLKDGREFIAHRDPAEKMDFGGKSYWGINHIKQIRQYYEALATGAPLFVPAEDALETQRMVCAIYESGKASAKRVDL